MAYNFKVVDHQAAADSKDTIKTIAEVSALLAGTNADPTAVGGYSTGSGGVVVQATDKSTAVTLSTPVGKVTLNGAALAAATIVSFTLTNTLILPTDLIEIKHVSAGTSGAYTVNAFPGTGSAVISVRNNTAGSLSEALVLRFEIRRSADA